MQDPVCPWPVSEILGQRGSEGCVKNQRIERRSRRSHVRSLWGLISWVRRSQSVKVATDLLRGPFQAKMIGDGRGTQEPPQLVKRFRLLRHTASRLGDLIPKLNQIKIKWIRGIQNHSEPRWWRSWFSGCRPWSGHSRGDDHGWLPPYCYCHCQKRCTVAGPWCCEAGWSW